MCTHGYALLVVSECSGVFHFSEGENTVVPDLVVGECVYRCGSMFSSVFETVCFALKGTLHTYTVYPGVPTSRSLNAWKDLELC